MIPLLPLAAGATVAGIGFTLGKKIADSFLIPWASDRADNLKRRWKESIEAQRKHQLDEIDPGPDEKASEK